MTTATDYSDFDSFSNSTRDWLISLDHFILNAANTLVTPEFIISFVGVVLNIFHLIILSRKSMRSSSTNVLMIGIALCDLFIMMIGVYGSVLTYIHPDVDCWAPSSYPRLVFDLWATALKDDFRRLSAWLGVLMAIVRFLIIKNSLNPKYENLSRPSLGWKIILILLVLSSIVSAFYWARIEIMETTPWVPAEHCMNFPANYTEKQYLIVLHAGFMDNKLLFLKIFLFVDGILKIIPAILLPILTFLLIRELNNAGEIRRKITASSPVVIPKKDHTTNLVILMTVTFMIAEGPLGTIYVAQGFLTTKPGFLSITSNLTYIMSIFVAINATTHFLLCITMSSQYQTCVKNVFGCNVKQRTVTVSPKISVTSVTSLRNVVVEI